VIFLIHIKMHLSPACSLSPNSVNEDLALHEANISDLALQTFSSLKDGIESGEHGQLQPKSTAHILLVEDDAAIAENAADALKCEGYDVDLTSTRRHAGAAADMARYDLIILDLGLPDGDGLELLRRWRGGDRAVPVIAVTARGGIEDRIRGLDAGADDYIAKPFEMRELSARVRAVLRRPAGALGKLLTFSNIEMDTVRRRLRIAGHLENAPRRELAILELLMRQAGTVVDRDAVMRAAYAADEHATLNALEANISRLRQKLAHAGARAELHTIRGVGYLLRENQ
jgi:DNA-binding response OmpR family regulator